jgi:hypothetical protein
MLIEFRSFELKEKTRKNERVKLNRAGWKTVRENASNYFVLFTKELKSAKAAVIELEKLLPDNNIVEDLWFSAESHAHSINNLTGVDLLYEMYPDVCPRTMREAVELLDQAVEDVCSLRPPGYWSKSDVLKSLKTDFSNKITLSESAQDNARS